MPDADKPRNQPDDSELLDLSVDDVAYLRWARDIGFDQEIQAPNLEPKKKEKYSPSVRGQIDNWFDKFYAPVLSALWGKHVPKTGACTVLQGELARCIGWLEGDLYRNGLMNIRTFNLQNMLYLIERTVRQDDKFSPLVKKVLEMDAKIVKNADHSEIEDTFSITHPISVELSLKRMKMVVAAWCVANPEPIEYKPNPDKI